VFQNKEPQPLFTESCAVNVEGGINCWRSQNFFGKAWSNENIILSETFKRAYSKTPWRQTDLKFPYK